jgi:hypothetical protein
MSYQFQSSRWSPSDELNWLAISEERPSMDIEYERNISAFAAATMLLLSLSFRDCNCGLIADGRQGPGGASESKHL